MNRKTSRLTLGYAAHCSACTQLAGPQRSQANMQLCEIERFYAFLAATDTYRSTLRAWY